MENKAFEFGPFRLEVRERRLTRDRHTVPLRGRVFDTLLALVRNHGCLMTKDELMAAVWADSVVEETNLNHNISVLRRALGEKVTGQKYIETVPRQGYRFVAEVKEVAGRDLPAGPESWGNHPGVFDWSGRASDAQMAATELESPSLLTERIQDALPAVYRSWYQRWGVVLPVAIVFVLLGSYLTWERVLNTGNLANSRIMLAVLPFENLTGDPAQKYVAEGLSHEIISQLGRWNTARLGVIARTSSKIYQGTHKSIGEIGRELSVDYVVEGSVRSHENRYRITVMLIRVSDQTHLWAANYDRTVDDVTALQVEIAKIITSQIGTRIGATPDTGSRFIYPQKPASLPNNMRNFSATDSYAALSSEVH